MKKIKTAAFFICVFLSLSFFFAIITETDGETLKESRAAETVASDTAWYKPEASSFSLGDIGQLRGLAELVREGISFRGKKISLSNDIEARTDFSIGGAGRPFEGIFDGSGNTLAIAAPLFAELKNSEIKDLFLDAAVIDGEAGDRGMLANAVYNSKIQRVSLNVKYINDSNQGNFGSVAAYAKDTSIEYCAAVGVIKKEDGVVGGIVAVSENCVIINCYNNTEITLSYLNRYAIGGIAGNASATEISACISYGDIILKSFFESGYPAEGYIGSICGIADALTAVKDCYYKNGEYSAIGLNQGQAASAEGYGANMLKSQAFFSILESLARGVYLKDIEGYEVNGGYPIFAYQIPNPVVALDITGSGKIYQNGSSVTKNFKISFGSSVEIKIAAERYYIIKSISWRGENISLEGDLKERIFSTDSIYDRSLLVVVFEKEMRTVELTGISASKVYDGTTTLDVSKITLGPDGLKISNRYSESDDIYIINGFTGEDPIRASFAFSGADTAGQYILLSNVKFGGSAVEYYRLPETFKIYAAAVEKAPLTVYYGGIDPETLRFTPGIAKSIYGDDALSGKYYGFSVHDDGFMLNGEFYLEIFLNGGFKRFDGNIKLQVGVYRLRPGGISSPNYNITFAECELTVKKRDLYVYYDQADTVYGSRPNFTFRYQNFIVGENESVLSSYPELSEDVLTAGSHRITLTGGYAENYNIVNIEGVINVAPKQIGVYITENQWKYYGDHDPALSGYSYGLCYNDSVVFERQAGENAGSYIFTQCVITAGSLDVSFCYAVTVINSGERFEIRKRTLIISAADISCVYGQTPAFSFSFDNLAPGDLSTSVSSLKIRLYAAIDTDFTTPLSGALNAGAYVIAPYGGVNDNYDISYTSGRLTVEKAVLRFIISDLTAVYGSALIPSYTVADFKYNQNQSVVNISNLEFFAEGAPARPDAGSYILSARGAAADNYSFEYIPASLTVLKAPLSIRINNAVTAVYGQDFPFEFIFEGFMPGDNAGNQLTNLRVPYAYTTEIQNVSPYAEARNYELSFFGNTLKIDRRVITVTGISIADKLYDGFSAAVITGSPVLSGVLDGDEVTLVGTPSAHFDYLSAGSRVPVTVSGLSITGSRAGMYELTVLKYYADIAVNYLSNGDIGVRSSGLLPYDGSLDVEFKEFKPLKKALRKEIGGRKLYYAVRLGISDLSGASVESGPYKIYITPDGKLSKIKNLKAVIISPDGKYTELKTRTENGRIVVESQTLGRVILVKNDYTALIITVILLPIIAALVFLYFYFFKDKKFIIGKRATKTPAYVFSRGNSDSPSDSNGVRREDSDDNGYEDAIRDSLSDGGEAEAFPDKAVISGTDAAKEADIDLAQLQGCGIIDAEITDGITAGPALNQNGLALPDGEIGSVINSDAATFTAPLRRRSHIDDERIARMTDEEYRRFLLELDEYELGDVDYET